MYARLLLLMRTCYFGDTSCKNLAAFEAVLFDFFCVCFRERRDDGEEGDAAMQDEEDQKRELDDLSTSTFLHLRELQWMGHCERLYSQVCRIMIHLKGFVGIWEIFGWLNGLLVSNGQID
jgi:hypothetical protein